MVLLLPSLEDDPIGAEWFAKRKSLATSLCLALLEQIDPCHSRIFLSSISNSSLQNKQMPFSERILSNIQSAD